MVTIQKKTKVYIAPTYSYTVAILDLGTLNYFFLFFLFFKPKLLFTHVVVIEDISD